MTNQYHLTRYVLEVKDLLPVENIGYFLDYIHVKRKLNALTLQLSADFWKRFKTDVPLLKTECQLNLLVFKAGAAKPHRSLTQKQGR